MATLVNPIIARKGIHLKTFKMDEEDLLMEFCEDSEDALKRNRIRNRQIVYTKVPTWKRSKEHLDTWQVFVIDESEIVK